MLELVQFYERGEMIDDGNRWRSNAGENVKLSNLYILTSLPLFKSYTRAHKYTHAPIHTRTFARNRCRHSRMKTFFAEKCSLSAIRNRGSRGNRGKRGQDAHFIHAFHVIHGFKLEIV